MASAHALQAIDYRLLIALGFLSSLLACFAAPTRPLVEKTRAERAYGHWLPCYCVPSGNGPITEAGLCGGNEEKGVAPPSFFVFVWLSQVRSFVRCGEHGFIKYFCTLIWCLFSVSKGNYFTSFECN